MRFMWHGATTSLLGQPITTGRIINSMNKRYIVSYQPIDQRDTFTMDAESHEEAQEIAHELDQEGYLNIIIDEVRI